MCKYFICFIIVFSSINTQAQYSYKKERANFSLIGRVGLPGDNATKGEFKSYYSLGLRKEFSLGKLISLNAVTDYNLTPGKNAYYSINALSLGGGITFYPLYLVNIIFGKPYDNDVATKDRFYIDEQFETNLNNTNYGNIGNIFIAKFEANIVKIYLNKNLSLSPKLGIVSFNPNNLPAGINNSFSFTYLGLALELGKNNR